MIVKTETQLDENPKGVTESYLFLIKRAETKALI
jgi:hypothetical protein